MSKAVMSESMCLCVNQGGTNHNCCTQRFVILDRAPVIPPDVSHPSIFPHPNLCPCQLSATAHRLLVSVALCNGN